MIFFSIATFFVMKISSKLFKNLNIQIWAGIFFIFSNAAQLLLVGIFKQFLSVDIFLLFFYLLIKYTECKRKGVLVLAFIFLAFNGLIYIFAFGITFLVLFQFFLKSDVQTKKVKWNLIKSIVILFYFSFLLGILFFWIFFGDMIPILSEFLNIYHLSILNTPSLLDSIETSIYIIYLGPQLIFAIYGYILCFRKRIITNRLIMNIISSTFEILLFSLFLNLFGIGFLADRIIHYLIPFLAIYSGFGINYLVKSLKDKTNKRKFELLIHKKLAVKRLLTILLLFSLISSLNIPFFRKSYWLEEETEGFDWHTCNFRKFHWPTSME